MRILSAERIGSAAGADQFPPCGAPEVAFLGRSNVGKSSLINRLVRRKKLAHTSAAPGKTRLAHWYRIRRPESETVFVDLPGYGYARVSKSERRHWKNLVESYLEGREALRAAVLLQDLRRDLSEDELQLLAWLRERGVPAVLALTKADKLKPMQRARRIADLCRSADVPDAHIVATSSTTGLGIDALWRCLDALL